MMRIIKCPSCKSEIAIDEDTIYPIDCDCGKEIALEEADWAAHFEEFILLETVNKLIDLVKVLIKIPTMQKLVTEFVRDRCYRESPTSKLFYKIRDKKNRLKKLTDIHGYDYSHHKEFKASKTEVEKKFRDDIAKLKLELWGSFSDWMFDKLFDYLPAELEAYREETRRE